MFLEERGVRGSLYLLILYFNSLLRASTQCPSGWGSGRESEGHSADRLAEAGVL